MATFQIDHDAQIKFVNHSNAEINYDVRTISSNQSNYGNIPPGVTARSHDWAYGNSLEYGNIAVIGIGQFGQPQLAPAPGVRFWSGNDGGGFITYQYINLLGENGWTVTRNTAEICEVTGNGFRVTVDGGGIRNPSTINVVIQVYNA